MSSNAQTILITGATGKQGSAVVNALLALHEPSIEILALTRNPDSPSAKALAGRSSTITLLKGDLDAPEPIFTSASTPITRVFSVQLGIDPSMTAAREITQGKALIDTAIAHGVQHFVYASADQGPPGKEEANYVPQMKSKVEIEAHLKAQTQAQAADARMTYTILRPVAFFDNLTDDYQGHTGFAFLKYSIRPSRKMQYIACADIGWFAARALVHPEQWEGRTIKLAGDELTWKEFQAVFKKTTGKGVPIPFGGRMIQWAVLNVALKDLGVLYRWFDENGSGADVAEVKRLHPEVMGLREWLGTTNYAKK